MTDTYFTGKPCRNGHLARRVVNSGRCVECLTNKIKRFYDNNRERKIQAARDYYYANKDAQIANMQARHARLKHEPTYIATRSAYALKHYTRIAKLRREKHSKPEYKATKAAQKKVQAPLYLSYETRRRARKLHAVPLWFGEFDTLVEREAAHLITLRRAATGVEWQLDHMLPLLARNVCGLHCATNMQVIPRTLNAQKCNKLVLTSPGEWIKFLDIPFTFS